MMSYAFSNVLRTEWNNEVVEYLTSKFNSINPWFNVLSESVFIRATLAKFGDVSFIINAANECLELSFAKADVDKMDPVIHEILKWDAFVKHPNRFLVKVMKDTSLSILFVSGIHQSPNEFKRHFQKYEPEIVLIGDK